MFDWDKDYSDLVGGSKHSIGAGRRAARPPQSITSHDSSDEHSARHLVLPLLIGAAFLIGLALEKGHVLQMVRPASVPADMLIMSEFQPELPRPSAQPESFVLPEELKIYDRDQYRRFMRGLQGLSVSELRELERAKRSDKARAPEGLAPYFHDALFLLKREIAQRGA